MKCSVAKKTASIILSILVFVASLQVISSAAFAAEESDLSFTVNDGGKSYTLTKCDSAASGEINVPAFYNEKPVTAIGANAFLGCTEITSVTVPEGVEEIGDKAFYNCRNLVTLKLPETVAAIGREAFSLCKKLSDITLPSGKCEIKQGAFTGCDVLKKVKLPRVTTDLTEMFYGCDSLETVILPESLSKIGQFAFYYCTSLKTIVIPENVDTISPDAFYDSALETVYGYGGSAAKKFAENNGFGFVEIEDVFEDEYFVTVKGAAAGSVLSVKLLVQSESEVAYKLTLTKDGEEIALGTYATVFLPVPESMEGKTCRVYKTENNGGVTNVNAVQDYDMEFTTDSLGEFIVTTGEISDVSGDLNNDGVCDVFDAQLCEKAVSGHIELSMRQKYSASGDAFCDVDASLYQRVVNEALKGA